jgi:hypothetical protein
LNLVVNDHDHGFHWLVIHGWQDPTKGLIPFLYKIRTSPGGSRGWPPLSQATHRGRRLASFWNSG